FKTSRVNGGSNTQPYTFEPYLDQELAFQISVKPRPENIPEGTEIQPAGSRDLKLSEYSISGLKSWHGLVSDRIVIITLKHNTNLNHHRITKEIDKAEKSKQTFILLDDTSRQSLVPKIRWDNLLLAHASSIDLSNRAF